MCSNNNLNMKRIVKWKTQHPPLSLPGLLDRATQHAQRSARASRSASLHARGQFQPPRPLPALAHRPAARPSLLPQLPLPLTSPLNQGSPRPGLHSRQSPSHPFLLLTQPELVVSLEPLTALLPVETTPPSPSNRGELLPLLPPFLSPSPCLLCASPRSPDLARGLCSPRRGARPRQLPSLFVSACPCACGAYYVRASPHTSSSFIERRDSDDARLAPLVYP